MIKLTKLLLVLLFLLFTGCEDKPVTVIVDNSDYMKKMDPRLKAYPEAVEWYEDAEKYPEAAANLGYFYHDTFKNYELAIKWYKNAFKGGFKKVSNNIGSAYRDLNDYQNAIKWYIKTDSKDSLNNLGLLYDIKLKDSINAIKYYKMAVERV